MRQKLPESQEFLLKDPHKDLLSLTHSELQCWDNSLKGIRDMWGGTELCRIRVRAGGAVFSQTEVLAEATVIFRALLPQSHHAGTKSKSSSTWLTLFTLPW